MVTNSLVKCLARCCVREIFISGGRIVDQSSGFCFFDGAFVDALKRKVDDLRCIRLNYAACVVEE